MVTTTLAAMLTICCADGWQSISSTADNPPTASMAPANNSNVITRPLVRIEPKTTNLILEYEVYGLVRQDMPVEEKRRLLDEVVRQNFKDPLPDLTIKKPDLVKVTVRVLSIKRPFIESMSISGNKRTVVLEILHGSTVPGDASVRTITIIYEHVMTPLDFLVGEKCDIMFTAKGEPYSIEFNYKNRSNPKPRTYNRYSSFSF